MLFRLTGVLFRLTGVLFRLTRDSLHVILSKCPKALLRLYLSLPVLIVQHNGLTILGNIRAVYT